MNRLSLSTPAGKQSRTGLNGINLESAVLALIVVVALCGLYLGWKLFWYLTDDAFIAFRYVSNSILGYGYVWNPPPFKPVEGYTSFLWVLVLDVVWRIFGVMPPDSANWISLGFSYLTLALSMIMFYRFDWNPMLKKFRIWFLILFLGAVLANRTFLAWTSSGLETAMFNFFLIYWVYSSYCLNPASRNWMWGVSVSTSLVYLTRPDGLLFSAATLLMVATVLFLKWREGRSYEEIC
jgi:arabinofuranosyltransferase